MRLGILAQRCDSELVVEMQNRRFVPSRLSLACLAACLLLIALAYGAGWPARHWYVSCLFGSEGSSAGAQFVFEPRNIRVAWLFSADRLIVSGDEVLYVVGPEPIAGRRHIAPGLHFSRRADDPFHQLGVAYVLRYDEDYSPFWLATPLLAWVAISSWRRRHSWLVLQSVGNHPPPRRVARHGWWRRAKHVTSVEVDPRDDED